MTHDEMTQYLWRLARKVSAEWVALITSNPYAEVYMFHKQGDAVAAEYKPDGYTLSQGRLGSGMTKDQCAQRVYDRLRSLPVLPGR
jgi:hypothetical protein